MHRKLRRWVSAFVWITALAALLVGCAPAQPPTPAPTAAPARPAATSAPAPAKASPAPTRPTEWTIGIAEETPTLDPAYVSQAGARQMFLHIYDPLLSFEGKDFKPVPMLAESWSRTDDQTWTFKLRKGVKFHNGDELTANDVKYTIGLYKLEKSGNRTNVAMITSVDVVDPYTVKITTQGPSPVLFGNLTNLVIIPQNAREKAGEDAFARFAVGTGPYKVVEYVKGQRLVLEANPSYWRGPVEPKKLTLRLIADPSTRVAELKTGGVQIIATPPPARLKELDGGDTQVMALKGGRLILYSFKTKEKPFDDVRLRQAVNYAVDRDAIIKNVLEGYGEPLHGPFAPAWLGYDPNLKPYPYDPEKAKRLLAEAGYPNGLETVFNITQGVFLKDREVAEAIAGQLARVGIKVQLVPTERAKILTEWQNGVFKGITSAGWGTSVDPDPMLGVAFYKRPGHTPDEKLNGLIDQSRRTVDPEQRKKILQDLGRHVHDQALLVFVHAQDEFYARRKEISWEPFPVGGSYAYTAYYQVPGR